MGQISDFYKQISKRDSYYFGTFLGYPALEIQNSKEKKIMEKSCQDVKEILNEIAKFYEQIYGLYRAYKHGYRVSFGQINYSKNIMAYVDNDENQKMVEYEQADIQKITDLCSTCSKMVNCIFHNHQQRNRHEFIGKRSDVEIKMVLKTNSKFRNDTYSFRYPTRGGRLNQDELESDKIYHEEFTAANEANHKGKIVAIDIDDKKIIHMDYDLGNVISYHNYESSNRIRIRRVGKDPRVGVRIW